MTKRKVSVKSVSEQFIVSAEVRMLAAEKCKTIIVDLNHFRDASFERQIQALLDRGLYTIDELNTLAYNLAITDEKNSEFIALKVITKIRQSIYALANNARGFFDGYTNSILSNLVRLQTIDNKNMLVSLSRAIEYSELDQVSDIKRTIDCSPSTASTQASSSRMMLRALSACAVTKRKNNDAVTFTEHAAARAIVALYQQ